MDIVRFRIKGGNFHEHSSIETAAALEQLISTAE